MKEAYSRLAQSIHETLRYYVAQQAVHSLDTIWISGGFALTPGFVGCLGGELREYRLRLWNPMELLKCRQQHKRQSMLDQGPAYAVAVGLAMRVL